MTPSPASTATVAISAPLNRAVYATLRNRAKTQGKSISDVLRPIVLAAVETGRFSAEGRAVEPNAMSLAVRVPLAVRDELRRQAEAQGASTTELLRAVLSANAVELGANQQ